jgi:microsomal dipeptidase-like Zn-dependent dipeptidase
MPFALLTAILLSGAAFAADAPPAWEAIEDASVELHAHPFMHDGLRAVFRGDFHGPLAATSWKDKISSQVNAEALDRSGIRILVNSLYAHPVLSLGRHASIRRQLDESERFVAERKGWIIARSASEARAALERGKRVMILALEGAEGLVEAEADIAELIDRRGIRIVTFLHLTDDALGGVALFKGIQGFMSPGEWVTQLFSPRRDQGVRVNRSGLTEKGVALARTLIRRGVWLDLAHSSDASQRTLLELLREANHPALYTHTSLRAYKPQERSISAEQLEAARTTQGIVGLMPSEDMIGETPGPCAPGCAGACEGGVAGLATQYREVASRIGGASTVLGSDYNGGVRHLKPSCGTGTSLDREGLWNIGQVAELWKALRAHGAPVPERLGATVTRFLDAWSRVKP